jgi:hypothetical protein
VKDACIVNGGQSICHLLGDASRLGEIDSRLPNHSGSEGLAGQQLHGQKGERAARPLAAKDVVDGAKIGMSDLPGEQYLPLESLLHVGFVGDLREDRF